MSGGGGGAVRAVRSQGGGAVVRWRKRACECGRMARVVHAFNSVVRRRSAQHGVRWAVGLAWVQLTWLCRWVGSSASWPFVRDAWQLRGRCTAPSCSVKLARFVRMGGKYKYVGNRSSRILASGPSASLPLH